MGKLEGKIAVVTGGSSGIGFATAKLFTEEGATVYITGRDPQKLEGAMQKLGRNAIAVPGDVGKLADVKALYDRIAKERGRVDIVFANAGWAEFKPLGQITEEHFDKTFNGNVKGALFAVQESLPLLVDGGAVVLSSSVVGSKGLPNNSIYAATKAVLRSFARTWTTDLKERKIRVNVVSPGPIETEGLSELLGDSEAGKQRRAVFATQVPLGRVGTADEVARAVLFLASDDASYITGTELFVDGGMGQV